jgi:hypothetical protein
VPLGVTDRLQGQLSHISTKRTWLWYKTLCTVVILSAIVIQLGVACCAGKVLIVWGSPYGCQKSVQGIWGLIVGEQNGVPG